MANSDDVAYRLGAFLRRTVDTTTSTIGSISETIVDSIADPMPVNDAAPTRSAHSTVPRNAPQRTPNGIPVNHSSLNHHDNMNRFDDADDAWNGKTGYDKPGVARLIIASFPDNSQVRWAIVPDQRTGDALIVATERFRLDSEDFVRKNRAGDDTVRVVSVPVDDETSAIISVFTDAGYHHGDVLAVIDVVEEKNQDGNTAIIDNKVDDNHDSIPKVPYNMFERRWPWDRNDKSKYKHTARSLRIL